MLEFIICAKYNGEVVGSLMRVANRELIGECRPFMVIENVVVSDHCRRMGIGKLLMEHIEKNSYRKKLFIYDAYFKNSSKRSTQIL